ncbi:MAG: sigma-54 dependent transcriptional regulator [Pirellulaceae bacterium]|nr:sigma-54-dependent Fis family transcriptional regulator [Planctomycetales bacterium]
MARLLVIDDEPNVRYSLEKALRSDIIDVFTAPTAKQGIRVVSDISPDAVLLDVRLPDKSGLDVFVEIQQIDPQLPVIMMTAFSTTDTAIEAMKRGAFDYLTKPVDLKLLRSVVVKALDLRRLTLSPPNIETFQHLDASAGAIVGHSPEMQEVYKAIGRVAETDVNVLILGESGTGKELVARAIHHHSRRSQLPMLAINCAAIPESLLESELFGHERGSFTGAERQRVGKFEQASGGTIFLDEIGDMTGATQAKVLRVLQDQRFERVGGTETVQADSRVIAATNQNLEELAAAGKFRQDLFYRLKVYTISLPALRERLDDLPLLVDYFIQLHKGEVGKRVRTASTETLELLRSYSWPGNVRELQGAIKNALVNATHEVITPECLPASIQKGARLTKELATSSASDNIDIRQLVKRLLEQGDLDIYHKLQIAVDRSVFDLVLRHVQGNQVEAARRLGISRTTLRAKLQAIDKLVGHSGQIHAEVKEDNRDD